MKLVPLLLGAAIPLAACQPYASGSFQTLVGAFPEARTTRGCIDIGIKAALDEAAEGPVIDVYMGNRCNEAVWIDLSRLEVLAQLGGGEEIPVGLYNPNQEIRAAVIGGRESLVERIELHAPLESWGVCANLDRVVAGKIQGGPPQLLCTEVRSEA